MAATKLVPAARRSLGIESKLSSLADASLEQLLQVCKGRILTSVEFGKAVEALVSGVERGAASSVQAQEWIDSCKRLLCSRPKVPLALWWIYSSLELQNAAAGIAGTVSGDERAMLVISASKLLLDRLRSLCAGRVDGYTGIAVLAPVLASLYQALLLLKHEKTSTKQRRKTLKVLKNSLGELLGTIALYNNRGSEGEAVETVGEEALVLDFRGLVLAGKGINKLSGSSSVKGLATVYPLSAKEVREASVLRSRSIEFWAAVVASEAVLLRLLASFMVQREENNGFASADFVEELKFFGVHGTCAFSKDTMIALAMERELPVSTLLNSEEVEVLRAALYEALLVDPAPMAAKYSPSSKAYSSFVLKLTLARRAVDYFRSHDQRTKAIAILSRVATSSVPLGFGKWLRAQKLKQKPDEDVCKDPRRLIGWLTQTADERTVSRILAKLWPGDSSNSKLEIDQLKLRDEAVEWDMFFVDKKGADDVADQLAADRAFSAAAEEMRAEAQQNENGGKLLTSEDEDSGEEPAGDNDEELEGDKDGGAAEEALAGNRKEEAEADKATALESNTGGEATEGSQKSSLECSVEAVLASSIQQIEAAEEKLEGAASERMEAETVEQEKPQEAGSLRRQEMAEENVTEQEEKQEGDSPKRQDKETENVDAEANIGSPMRQEQPAVVEAAVTPRCTRSGRKYGAFQAPLAVSSRKKRRI